LRHRRLPRPTGFKTADLVQICSLGYTSTERPRSQKPTDPPPEPAAGAGERGPASCCRLPVPGEPAGKKLYPLVSELAADNIPVAVSLRVLKLSRQPYYRWRKQQVTNAELIEAYRANALLDAHVDDPEYGYRLLVYEAADAGEKMCERTAWKICQDNQWWSVFGKKPGKNGAMCSKEGSRARAGSPSGVSQCRHRSASSRWPPITES